MPKFYSLLPDNGCSRFKLLLSIYCVKETHFVHDLKGYGPKLLSKFLIFNFNLSIFS